MYLQKTRNWSLKSKPLKSNKKWQWAKDKNRFIPAYFRRYFPKFKDEALDAAALNPCSSLEGNKKKIHRYVQSRGKLNQRRDWEVKAIVETDFLIFLR